MDALFLSTLSLRRATRLQSRTYQAKDDFYPRSPCGERHAARLPRPAQILISIHALLAESDALVAGFATLYANFYPRSPCGERPAQIIVSIQNIRISIHALLAESDFRAWAWLTP